MGKGYAISARGSARAEILIYEDVGESWFGGVTAKQFSADLKALGNIETIDVRINSAGGDVFDGLAIYRQLVEHKARVVTHIDGIAASIASVIAMAGNEIRISESAFVMVHDAWAMAIGNASELRSMASRLEITSEAITDIYQARTNYPRAEIRSIMEGETWLTAGEAIEKGFADVLVENLRMAARVDLTAHKFRNAPRELVENRSTDLARARVEKMRQKLQSA